MTEAPEPVPEAPSDAALISAVRRGDNRAYGLLYQRHLAAARRAAGFLSARRSEREDLVAEAFTRVLQTLRAGRGPSEEFRPYLLVTMRHVAINAARRSPSTALFADVPDSFMRSDSEDPIAARMHSSDAVNAFAELPERWRMVLWHTEIEGESPAEIAPLLGMTPNGVAALAYRAREGLRQAYLRAHLPDVDRRDCRAAADKLVGWVRRSISVPQQRKLAEHLERCPRCRELADGLEQVNGELRAVLAPIMLGTALAAGYLHTAATAATAVSWLSAVKASITAGAAQAAAATAIAAATAVSVVASNPGADVTATGPGERAIVTAPVIPAANQSAIPARTMVVRPPEPPPGSPAGPPAAESPLGVPPASAHAATPAKKDDKKATKQEEKAARKAAKQAEKEEKKAAKKAAEEEQKPPK